MKISSNDKKNHGQIERILYNSKETILFDQISEKEYSQEILELVIDQIHIVE